MFQSLRQLMQDTKRTKHALGRDGRCLSFAYNEPATPEALDALPLQGLRLSAEHRRLLALTDGFEIFNFDGLDGYKLYSVEQLPEINASLRACFENAWPDDLVIAMGCIGEGNYLGVGGVGKSNGFVVDCFTQEQPDGWRVISPNLDGFLAALIEAQGAKFWLSR